MTMPKIHCLFEQSGTFKNEFKKLGYDAEDYDIQNEFGETDNVVDLFTEICNAYDEKPSIFDRINENDIVMAFFPCTRFEAQIQLWFSGKNYGCRNWPDEKKLEYAMDLHKELHEMYLIISKLFLLSLRGGWKMVVENPSTQPHYLTTYFPIRPKLIDKDRTMNGDYFKKPTQFWFVNMEPHGNFVTEALTYHDQKIIERTHSKTERSMISRQYARKFILENIVDRSIEGVVICLEKGDEDGFNERGNQNHQKGLTNHPDGALGRFNE